MATKRASWDVKSWWEAAFDTGPFKFRRLNSVVNDHSRLPFPATVGAPAAGQVPQQVQHGHGQGALPVDQQDVAMG